MILVTGAAGFIGFHITKRLLSQGFEVFGVDNINDYYDTSLKYDRLKELGIAQEDIYDDKCVKSKNFNFLKTDLKNLSLMTEVFDQYKFKEVIHLAAQAGVRYSITNPQAYIDSNLIGFANIIELSKQFKVAHFIYASSSSVYGNNKKVPFAITDNVDNPVSLYAATKKSNELIAHTYSHIHQLNTTGLRFFTVYGPWGRPDMAYFKFTKSIYAETAIDVYNRGKLSRDFTYIDDIIDGIISLYQKGGNGYSLYNIGNNKPVKLLRFIEILENLIGKKAIKNMLPMQQGDVFTTYADISDLARFCNYKPSWLIDDGLNEFVKWYEDYYK